MLFQEGLQIMCSSLLDFIVPSFDKSQFIRRTGDATNVYTHYPVYDQSRPERLLAGGGL
jgi:hypothetical protein